MLRAEIPLKVSVTIEDNAMKNKISHARQDNVLRMPADKLMSEQGGRNKKLIGKDAAALLHELQTHQIELELQNEELRETRQELEAGKSRYADLYDFAPVGYFALNEQSIILQANLTGSAKLGVERSLLVNKLFTSHVARDSQDIFYFHRQQIFRGKESHRCEIALLKKDGTPWYALLESVPVADSDGTVKYCRTVVTDITERKRAEDALLESEALKNTVLDSLAAHIVVLDAQGIIVATNAPWRKFARENGLPNLQNATAGDSYLSVCRAALTAGVDDAAEHLHGIENILSGKCPLFTAEYPCHSPAEKRWFMMRVTKRSDQEGGIVIAHENITGRKQAEEALKASEERFRSVMEQANDSIYITDSSGVIKSWNRKSEELYGYTAGEVLGKQHYILLPERKKEKHAQWLDKIIAAEGALSGVFGEEVNVCKDGSELYVEMSLAPLPQGDELFFVVINRDITGRKRAEETLHRAIRAYKALSDCNKAVLRALEEEALLCEAVRIVQKDCEYCFSWIGVAEHDEGKTVRPVAQAGPEKEYLETARVTWEDNERGRGPTGTAIRTGKPVIIEDLMIDPSFAPWRKEAVKRGYVSAAAVPLRNGAGSIGALTVYATTAGAFNGEEIALLQELADNLAYGITSLQMGKKQVQLESQLLQAQKLEAIGTLSGGIAHDFNNILAAIMGNTEMALQILPEYSTAHKHLEQVLKSSERASNLVKQILAFSRKSQENREPLEMKRAVTEVITMLRSTLPTSIEIRENIVSDAWVTGSEIQMHQVLLNLCTNASHSMRKNGGVLGIELSDVNIDAGNSTAYHDFLPGDYVKLSVIDTGTGIAPEIMKRIFDPFFTTKGVGEGTGMGLSVVYGIVKSHGGDITVESEPGKGTSFHILLPKSAGKAAEKENVKQPVPRGTERILLVDDEAIIVDIGQKMLEMLGYRVTTAKSGTEALDIFKKGPDAFDLVITDYTMPKMNGYDLAQQMMEVRPDIPLIMNTGYNEMISQEKSLSAGIREFLLKPLDLRKLGEVVRRVLDGKGKGE